MKRTTFDRLRAMQTEGKALHDLIADACDTGDDLIAALDILVLNARVVPDPRMGGSTDCYAVPIDDIETAIAALNRARSANGHTPDNGKAAA